MSTQHVVLTTVLMVAFFSLPVMAQGTGEGSRQASSMGNHRMEKLQKSLDLTEEQTAKIKAIFEASRPAMKAQKEKMHEQMKAHHEQVSEQIKAVLTAEQKKKYETMEAERKERFENRKHKKGHHGGEASGEGLMAHSEDPSAELQEP